MTYKATLQHVSALSLELVFLDGWVTIWSNGHWCGPWHKSDAVVVGARWRQSTRLGEDIGVTGEEAVE
jgi:hypothetical protein